MLEGALRFRCADREVDAPAGTTSPAGVAHTYRVTELGRHLIFLPPRLDALIARLRALTERSRVRELLDEFDTEMAE